VRPGSPRALVFLVFAGALSGCGKFQKNKECGDLAGAVNAFIDETKKAVPAEYAEPSKAARESRALASRYRKLHTDLGALKVESEELVLRLERYKKLAEEAATALDGAAQALDKKDLELARRYRLDFDRTAKSEAPLVREINRACAR
jgi:hypothetical protein